jgi:cytochrome c biogenesis protein CcmG, thiol:disulfide interchange protein DsbE
MARLIYLLPLALFLALAGYFAIGLTRDPSKLPSTLIDRPAPAFALPAVIEGGQGLARADLTGRPVLVNFYASWCAPCRIEHPALMRLVREQGVIVHGIAYKDKPEAARAFLAQLGNPYARNGLDLDGRAGIEWGITGVPETFVIDAGGRIRFRFQGPLNAAVIENDILPLLRGDGR